MAKHVIMGRKHRTAPHIFAEVEKLEEAIELAQVFAEVNTEEAPAIFDENYNHVCDLVPDVTVEPDPDGLVPLRRKIGGYDLGPTGFFGYKYPNLPAHSYKGGNPNL